MTVGARWKRHDGTAAGRRRSALAARSGARSATLEALAHTASGLCARSGLRIAAAGLGACDVARATEQAVAITSATISIVDGVSHRLDPDGRVVVLGSGKATLGDRRRTRARSSATGSTAGRSWSAPARRTRAERIEVLGADHPLPERAKRRRGAPAARAPRTGRRRRHRPRLLHRRQLGAREPAPGGRRAADKRALHELLLASGIADRRGQHRPQARLRLQGRPPRGADRCPRDSINLTVSDVAGDTSTRSPTRPSPTTPRPTTRSRCSAATDSGSRSPTASATTSARPPPGSPDLAACRSRPSCWSRGRAPATRWRARRSRSGYPRTRRLDHARGRGARDRPAARPTSRARAPRAAPPFAPAPSAGRMRRREHRHARPTTPRSAPAARTRRRRSPLRWRSRARRVAAVFIDTDGSDGGTEHRRARSSTASPAARAADAGLDLRAALARAPLRATRSTRSTTPSSRGRPGPTSTTCSCIAIGAGEALMEASGQPMIVLDRVTRSFGDGAGRRRRLARDRRGRVLLDARPERLRQDDDAADDRRLRGARLGPGAARRRGRDAASRPGSATSTWSSRTTRCSRT